MQSAAEFSLDVIVREFPEVKDLLSLFKRKNSGDGFLLGVHERIRSKCNCCNVLNDYGIKGVTKKVYDELKSSKVKTIQARSQKT